MQVPSTFPSIQLLALEMLLHYFLGTEAAAVAAKNKLILSLGESLEHATTVCLVQQLSICLNLHWHMVIVNVALYFSFAKKNQVGFYLKSHSPLCLLFFPEPLKHPLLSGASSFTKHAVVLTSSIRDGFINIGKEAPGKHQI